MQTAQARRKYGILLAVIAVAILVVGFLLKPKRRSQQKQANLEITTIQGELERLRELAQRNSLRNTSARFALMANDAATHLAFAKPLNQTAISWTGGTLLLARGVDRVPEPLQVQSNDTSSSVQPANWGAGVPFALVKPAADLHVEPSTIARIEALSPGAWILQVHLGSKGNPLFGPGIYSGTSSITCGDFDLTRIETNLPLDESAIGGGLFDLDGNLVGVVAQCESGIAAIGSASIQRALSAADSAASSAFFRMGMGVTEIAGVWQSVLKGRSGVVVSRIWNNWPAERAGLRPGDVIVAVNRQSIRTAAELASFLGSSPTPELQIERRTRRIMIILPLTASADFSAVQFESPAAGLTLARVEAGSSAARAGLRSGDHVLTINGTDASATMLTRSLGPQKIDKPVLVVAQRGACTFATVVTP